MKHALMAPHGVDEQSCSAQVLSEAISPPAQLPFCWGSTSLLRTLSKTDGKHSADIEHTESLLSLI